MLNNICMFPITMSMNSGGFGRIYSSRGGVSDSKPMTIFECLVMLEKRGTLDMKLSGHQCQRPASVVRGEDQDRT